MNEYVKFTSDTDKTTYFYRVNQFVKVFKENIDAYSYTQEFKDADLLEARSKAIACFKEREQLAIDNPYYYDHNIEGPQYFDKEVNAAHSLSIALVECYEGSEYIESEYFIAGESLEELHEGREFERYIFNKIGANIDYNDL